MPIQIPSGLVQAAKRKEVVLFAGAGISFEALKVGGLELRDLVGSSIKEDYQTYDYASRSFEDVCDEYEIINGRTPLVGLLANSIPQSAKPLEGHIAAVKSFRFIVTTNWDQLFEAAAKSVENRYHVLSDEVDAPLFNYDNHNLLKIHGSIDRPSSLICTTEDFEGYADTHPNLLNRVAGLMDNYTVLFVGYGMRDEHLRRLFYQIKARNGKFARKHYIIGFYDEVRKLLLEGRGMYVINEDATVFLKELENRINQ